jgi:hypothetical protein
VIPVAIHRLARMMGALSTWLLPPALRHWGVAMQSEIEVIERADRAMLFALGSLGFACQQFLSFYILRPLQTATTITIQEINMKTNLLQHPQRLTAFCAFMATSLGLVYMTIAGVPLAYLAMNSCALVIGFLLVGIVAFIPRSAQLNSGSASLALGVILLFTSLLGVTANGATRWIVLGGVAVQPSLIILPVITLGFARARNASSVAALVLASLALALQPDRAMSGSLAAGMIFLMLLKPEKNVMIATGAAVCGFLATMLQPDVEPASPYVDQIFFSSFDVHPLAGIAVLVGAMMMILPSIIGCLYDIDRREIYAVFGIVWFAVIVAAALGNYPTPLVGYGGSAIIGYVISLLGLPQHTELNGLDRQDVGTSASEPEQHNLHIGLSYSL